MAGRVEFHRNSAGIAAILKTQCVPMVSKAAEHVGNLAKSEIATVPNGADFKIQVDEYVTDRAAAAVMIADPAGERVEGKYHVLKRSAGAAGLTVHRRRRG